MPVSTSDHLPQEDMRRRRSRACVDGSTPTTSSVAAIWSAVPPTTLHCVSTLRSRMRATVQCSRLSRTNLSLAELTALVAKMGVRLRDKLGIVPPRGHALGLVANEQPPNVDVARRMGFALDALRHYDPARARDELIEAVAQAPGYAPAYTYLAQAWSALGYRDKALAAAGQAAQNAANLPLEQRLLTEAVLESERSDWAKAVDAWQALVKLKPLNPEYRLHQIDAQIAAGEATTSAAHARRSASTAGRCR